MKTRYSIAMSALLLVLGLVVAPAFAEDAKREPDVISLSDGSRVLGRVKSLRDGILQVKTDFAGTLEIPLEKVTSLRTSVPVVMQLDDEEVLEGQPLVVEDGEVVIADSVGQPRLYPLDELRLVNPEPWEIGRGYKWSGLVNFAFKSERGNSDTDELDYRLESVWRSDDDRYTLKYWGEQDEANNVKSADNWTLQGKYDYFFDGPTYGGVQAYAEADKFSDLDLRYYIGPYIGREFFTEPIFMLSADAGIAYVNEDYFTAQDQDYPGATWNIDLSSNYLGGDSRLYFIQNGIWNLEETSDVVINSAFGLAFPLLWRFEAAAEILLEYDSGAVEGVDDLDETYSLRLGYTW